MNGKDARNVREQSTDERMIISVGEWNVSVAAALKLVNLIVLAIVPFFIGTYYTGFLTQAILFGIFALGVDIIWGYTGVMTFGHALFFGMGAYSMAKLLKMGVFASSYVGLGLAILIPSVVALIVAGVLFYEDIDDIYFTIITLALAIIGSQSAVSLRGFTGGYDGIQAIPALELGIPGVSMHSLVGLEMYYLTVLVMIGIYLLARRLVNSPFGTTLVAIKHNELKARSMGYKTEKYKTLSFVAGSAIAGFAGGLYATYSGFVNPTLLGFILSTNVLLWVLVGGQGTLIGPLFGTVLFKITESQLSSYIPFSWTLVLGVLLVAIVAFFPAGLAGAYGELRDRLNRTLS